jgi:hypothetical protein
MRLPLAPLALSFVGFVSACSSVTTATDDPPVSSRGDKEAEGRSTEPVATPATPEEAPEGPATTCADGAFTCVDVTTAGPYGTRTFDVPAAQNWVNTGVFLHLGETATIEVSGDDWVLNPDKAGRAIDHGKCVIGAPVARIGLSYKDPEITCLGRRTTLTADKDGILFVGGLADNDLGESYEARVDARGKKQFTVTSDGATVPSVAAEDAATYAFDNVASGWVEVYGDHVVMTLPVATAQKDASTLAAAARRLDDIYELHEKLRGARPHHGQRLRFFPDEVAPGYMLAGNPIRVKAAVVSGKDEARISRAGEATNDPWGFAHEMGHDFTFATGFWQYQNKSLEAWPNVFSIHALEALGLPIHDQAAGCTSTSTGSYLTTESWSPWTALCFLMQLKFDHGWELYERFFAAINTNHTMPNQGSGEKTAWYFVHDRFEEAAKADVTPTFAAWNVPHP